jgi:hypothetical protein
MSGKFPADHETRIWCGDIAKKGLNTGVFDGLAKLELVGTGWDCWPCFAADVAPARHMTEMGQ